MTDEVMGICLEENSLFLDSSLWERSISGPPLFLYHLSLPPLCTLSHLLTFCLVQDLVTLICMMILFSLMNQPQLLLAGSSHKMVTLTFLEGTFLGVTSVQFVLVTLTSHVGKAFFLVVILPFLVTLTFYCLCCLLVTLNLNASYYYCMKVVVNMTLTLFYIDIGRFINAIHNEINSLYFLVAFLAAGFMH